MKRMIDQALIDWAESVHENIFDDPYDPKNKKVVDGIWVNHTIKGNVVTTTVAPYPKNDIVNKTQSFTIMGGTDDGAGPSSPEGYPRVFLLYDPTQNLGTVSLHTTEYNVFYASDQLLKTVINAPKGDGPSKIFIGNLSNYGDGSIIEIGRGNIAVDIGEGGKPITMHSNPREPWIEVTGTVYNGSPAVSIGTATLFAKQEYNEAGTLMRLSGKLVLNITTAPDSMDVTIALNGLGIANAFIWIPAPNETGASSSPACHFATYNSNTLTMNIASASELYTGNLEIMFVGFPSN